MPTLHNSIELIQRSLDEWTTPYVERDIFGTDNAAVIADTIDAFCRRYLGSVVRGHLFYAASVGSTHGVMLEDGSKVVIEVRPPVQENPYLNLGKKNLETICRVMQWLYERRFPCPKPVLGPTALGKGLATVEEYFAQGERGNGFRPACRKTIAKSLAGLIGLLKSCDIDAGNLQHRLPENSLYPQPHGKIFDFETTAAGAEWIDELARRARRAMISETGCVLGHADWRAEHLRFSNGRIVATYDWDSLSFRSETDLVGISAHGFTADWSLPESRRIPTGDDIRAFIADYEQGRGKPFSKQERHAVFASCVYWLAYGARCQHALHPEKIDWEKDSFISVLLAEGKVLLSEAG